MASDALMRSLRVSCRKLPTRFFLFWQKAICFSILPLRYQQVFPTKKPKILARTIRKHNFSLTRQDQYEGFIRHFNRRSLLIKETWTFPFLVNHATRKAIHLPRFQTNITYRLRMRFLICLYSESSREKHERNMALTNLKLSKGTSRKRLSPFPCFPFNAQWDNIASGALQPLTSRYAFNLNALATFNY